MTASFFIYKWLIEILAEMTIGTPIFYHIRINVSILLLEYIKPIGNLLLVYYILSMIYNALTLFFIKYDHQLLTIWHMNTNKDIFWEKIMKQSANQLWVMWLKIRQKFLKNQSIRLFLLPLPLLFQKVKSQNQISWMVKSI